MKQAKISRLKTNYKALLRAMAAVSAIVVIVGGVTFAVLQSQQVKLAGNTIQTASANLGISRDGFNYVSSANGFNFNDVTPGGSAVPENGNVFYLKNSGNATLKLRLSVDSEPTNPDNVDLSKLNVILTPNNGGPPQNVPLQILIDANQIGGYALAIPALDGGMGTTVQFKIQVSMDIDAFSGSSASLGNIDFAFSGEAVAN